MSREMRGAKVVRRVSVAIAVVAFVFLCAVVPGRQVRGQTCAADFAVVLWSRAESDGEGELEGELAADIIDGYRRELRAQSNAAITHLQLDGQSAISELAATIADAPATMNTLQALRARAQVIADPDVEADADAEAGAEASVEADTEADAAASAEAETGAEAQGQAEEEGQAEVEQIEEEQAEQETEPAEEPAQEAEPAEDASDQSPDASATEIQTEASQPNTTSIQKMPPPDRYHLFVEIRSVREEMREAPPIEIEPEIETLAETEGETDIDADIETEAETGTEVDAETEAETGAETGTDTDAETEIEAEAETNIEAETEADAEAAAETSTETEAEAEARAEANATEEDEPAQQVADDLAPQTADEPAAISEPEPPPEPVLVRTLLIETDLLTIDTTRHYRTHRATIEIEVPAPLSADRDQIGGAIREAIAERLRDLRAQGALPRRYAIVYRDGNAIFMDNNGDDIPIGAEFIPLIPTDDLPTELCTPQIARHTLRTSESYQYFALLQNISTPVDQPFTHVVPDTRTAIIETRIGYVFPVFLQESAANAYVPGFMMTAEMQVAPILHFERVRPFFSSEIHAIIEQVTFYSFFAVLGGVEMVWHLGPLTFEPSLALGVSIGGGFNNSFPPFFLAAAGGNVKLLTSLQVERNISLFLEVGFIQWFPIYHEAPSSLQARSTILSNGYGGVETSFGISVKVGQ